MVQPLPVAKETATQTASKNGSAKEKDQSKT